MSISKRELRFAQIAVKNRLITEKDAQSCIKLALKRQRQGHDPVLSEILIERKLLTARDVKSIVNAQTFKEQRLWDKLYGRIALKNQFVNLEQIDECLAIQKKRYLGGKDFPRIAELLLQKGYLTRSENRAIRSALNTQSIEDHFPHMDELSERLLPVAGSGKKTRKKPKKPPSSGRSRERKKALVTAKSPALDEPPLAEVEPAELEEPTPTHDNPSALGFFPAIKHHPMFDRQPPEDASESGTQLPDLESLEAELGVDAVADAKPQEASESELPSLEEIEAGLDADATSTQAALAEASESEIVLPALEDLENYMNRRSRRSDADQEGDDPLEEDDGPAELLGDDEQDEDLEPDDDDEDLEPDDDEEFELEESEDLELKADEDLEHDERELLEQAEDNEETVRSQWDGDETSLDGFPSISDSSMQALARKFEEAIGERETQRAEARTEVGLTPIDPSQLPPPVGAGPGSLRERPTQKVSPPERQPAVDQQETVLRVPPPAKTGPGSFDSSDFSIGPGSELQDLLKQHARRSDGFSHEETTKAPVRALDSQEEEELEEVYELLFDGEEFVISDEESIRDTDVQVEEDTWTSPQAEDTWGGNIVLCPRCEVPFRPEESICEYCGYQVAGKGEDLLETLHGEPAQDLVDTRRSQNFELENPRFDELGLIAEEGPIQILRLEDRWLGGPCLAIRLIGRVSQRGLRAFKKLNHHSRLSGAMLFLELLEVQLQNDAVLVVYENCDGAQLSQRLERGALEENDAHWILRQLSRGFSLLHRAEVVAGEISPQTAFLAKDGTVRLLGLGMSQLLSEIDEVALPGASIHLAPERREQAPSTTTDVYALGSFFSTLLPNTERPEVKALLNKTLAPSADRRFASAEVMDNFLKRVFPGPHVPSRRFEHCGCCWNLLASTDAENCELCGASLEVPCLHCQKKVRRGSPICHHCDADLIEIRSNYRQQLVGAFVKATKQAATGDRDKARQTLLAVPLPDHPEFHALSQQVAIAAGNYASPGGFE